MDKKGKIIQFFKEKGNVQTVQAAGILDLHTKRTIYAFEKGEINVYAQKCPEKKEEERHFLAHFTEALLFSLDMDSEKCVLPDYCKVFGASETQLQVFTISEELLMQELSESEDLQKEFCFHLDEWIHRLPQNVSKSFSQEFKYSIFPGQSLEVPREEILSVKKPPHTMKKEQISWVSPEDGKLLLYGDENFAFSNPEEVFPLTSQFWFKAAETAKIHAFDTLTLVQNQFWTKGLKCFHQLFINYLPKYLQQQQEHERLVLESRKAEEKKNLNKAFKQLESVLSPSVQADVESVEGELEQACQILAKAQKIKFVFPQVNRDAIKDYVEHLGLICEVSHLRNRRVRLIGDWWKQDHGPLLAFYGEENKPVALIHRGKYRMGDLSTDQVVTEEIAKNLSPFAYMFYTPFASNLKTGKEILQLVWKKFKKKCVSMVIYGVIGSVIAFFPPIATNLLFNYAVPESSLSLVLYLMAGLIFSAIGFSFFYFLRDYMLLKIEGLVANFIQPAFWDRLLKLPPSFFRKFTIGNLFWRTMTIEEIRTLISGNASAQILTGVFSIFYLIIMWVYAPTLTGIVLAVVLFGLITTFICCYYKIRFLRKALVVQGDIRGILIEMIGGVSKLRVAGAEKNAIANWALLYAKNTSLNMKIQTMQNIVSITSAALPVLCFLGIYFAMLHLSSTQGIELPDFLAFSIALGSFSLAIFPMNETWIDLANIVPLWERSQDILEEPLEQTEDKVNPGKLTGEININNVSFGYDPERPPILKGISIKVRPREFIGIVGQSGVGKSTLIRLLLGFEKPQEGAIYYDGKDLDKLDVRAVRKQLGIVLQGSGIMAGSVYDNIACGGLYEEHEVEQAINISGFNEVLEDLPMGLHTFIQMNGTNLSGGQKQRLLLARALIGSPSILIFDEATSALDNQSQRKLSHNIEELNVTRIVIAHRLSTIQNANRIYVIGKGGILQEGSFEELACQSGVFSEMLAKQSL